MQGRQACALAEPLGPAGAGRDDGAVAQMLASGDLALDADGALWLHT